MKFTIRTAEHIGGGDTLKSFKPAAANTFVPTFDLLCRIFLKGFFFYIITNKLKEKFYKFIFFNSWVGDPNS